MTTDRGDAPGPVGGAPPRSGTTDGPATVLIVDDDREFADRVASWLRDDYAVRIVRDGDAAFAQLTRTVDVVLLGRRAPTLRTAAVLAEGRALDCRVAAVAERDPAAVPGRGVDEYLVRPVGRTAVRDAVERLVEMRDCDALLREYFALASERATLEANDDGIDSDDYRRVAARLDELKRAVDERTGALLAAHGGKRVFRQLRPEWRAPLERTGLAPTGEAADD